MTRTWFATIPFLVAVGLAVLWSLRPSTQGLLSDAERALAIGEVARAEHLALRVTARDPQHARALRLAGEAAARQQRYDAAVGYFEQVPEDGGTDFAEAQSIAGLLRLQQLGQASAAEECFRRALRHDPHHLAANAGLFQVLEISGRRWEAVPHVLELLRQEQFRANHLHILGSEPEEFRASQQLQECARTVPDDPVVLLGLAHAAINSDDPARARPMLEQALRSNPLLIAAHARLGELLLRSASADDFIEWHAQLPPPADQHPEIWMLRGECAKRQEERQVAVRCYWEALRRDPNLRAANYQLALTLTELGEAKSAAPFFHRGELLQDLREVEGRLSQEGVGLPVSRERVRLLVELGRYWEAWGWSRIVMQRDSGIAWAEREVARLQSLLATGDSLTATELNPALHIDFSDRPRPHWSGATRASSSSSQSPAAPAAVTFEDDAREAGLNFQWYRDEGSGLKMYELMGGGVAVLDYDNDGWPDVELTQGSAWPPETDSQAHLDVLFRNRGDGTFADVTAKSGLVENSYSQGITAGDVDADGFPDLFVANIGRNRLYRNNGDGTFSDATDVAGLDEQQWTTSCTIADLNADGLPDLYAVNYLEGDGVFERVCRHPDGAPRTCEPSHFPAAQDQLYLNLGDGRFRNVTQTAGIEVSDGKGLGVVVADLDGLEGLDLFIANDAVPNFLFLNRTSNGGTQPRFTEEALPRGLALDRAGRAQACMGTAADDADGDHRLDLFVTNFRRESNTLYMQDDAGFFADHSAEAGLMEPSLPLLGFGTQFLDAELDGWPDLIVTNGHVYDFRAYGQPYEMPPQVFRNQGQGQFAELPAESLGPYFEGKYLGRGLARLDWNRDGREDVVVSHIDAPAALLTNTTPQHGHSLAVALRGTKSDRDAIGAVVEVDTGRRTLVRQLTAGDGYQASNQRLLVFGLGTASEVERLRIRWPSGLEQEWRELRGASEMLCVEGAARPLVLSAR